MSAIDNLLNWKMMLASLYTFRKVGIKLLLITIMLIGMLNIACSQIPDFGGEPMNDMEEIESELYSSYPEEGEINKILTSEKVFEMEWAKVHEGMDPMPEIPDVNFGERKVILVILETKPTGGYGFAEFTVHENADEFVVFYSELHPGDGCFTTQALSRPYKFVSIPSAEKEVKFVKGDPVLNHCDE